MGGGGADGVARNGGDACPEAGAGWNIETRFVWVRTMGLTARCVGLQARQPVNDWRVLSDLINPQVAGMEGVAPMSRQQVVDEAVSTLKAHGAHGQRP